MPSKCSKCGFYWGWNVGAPYACPKCHEVASFKPCEEEQRTRGRQPTPEGWICVRCRDPTKKLHARDVCRECFNELSNQELLQKPPPFKRGRPPRSKSLPEQVEHKSEPNQVLPPSEPIITPPEPWYCPDCGSKWEPEVTKCRICNPYCEGCKTYKELYKGSLCEECYQKSIRQNAQEDTPKHTRNTQEGVEALIRRMGPKLNRNSAPAGSDIIDSSHVCPHCGLVALPHDLSCSACGSLIEESKYVQFIVTHGTRKITKMQIVKELEKLEGHVSPDILDHLKKLILLLYFKYDVAYPDSDKPLQNIQVSLTNFQVGALTDLVEKQQRFVDRSEAIRVAVRDLILKESRFQYVLRKKKSSGLEKAGEK